MEIFKTPDHMRQWSLEQRLDGATLGLVPTMGVLHHGHTSLIKRSQSECNKTVVSIFVNPTQFSPNEDFERYPRAWEADRVLCETLGVDVIFAPSVEAMYPAGFTSKISVSPLSACLCGATRPGHFDGVSTVVVKLFNIVQPHCACFGEKDYQQLRIIEQAIHDLNIPVTMIRCPIVRDPDGLAASSRNQYLTSEERQAALRIPQALQLAMDWAAGGERDSQKIKEQLREYLQKDTQCRVEYIAVVDAEKLLDRCSLAGTMRIMVAVFIGHTRLIDNRKIEA